MTKIVFAKEDQQKQSPQEEVSSLKRQLAGSKGRNKQLAEENKALHEKIAQITADKERLRSVLTETRGLSYKYLGELRDARIELTDYKAIVEWYNELPWWRKMFLFRLL